MKTVPKKTALTVRPCPSHVQKALKESAKANHRSVNGEALTWLERQAAAERPKPAKELVVALRKAHKLLRPVEHQQVAEGIEEARRRMANEHLYWRRCFRTVGKRHV